LQVFNAIGRGFGLAAVADSRNRNFVWLSGSLVAANWNGCAKVAITIFNEDYIAI
jgi:hypothetical protein